MCIVVSQLEGWGDVYCGLTSKRDGGMCIVVSQLRGGCVLCK